MYGKRVGKTLALKLFKGERVFVEGLKSRNGKSYSAYMRLEGEKVRLDFGKE